MLKIQPGRLGGAGAARERRLAASPRPTDGAARPLLRKDKGGRILARKQARGTHSPRGAQHTERSPCPGLRLWPVAARSSSQGVLDMGVLDLGGWVGRLD